MNQRIVYKWMRWGRCLRAACAFLWEFWFEIVIFGILIAVPIAIVVSVLSEGASQ